VTDQFEKNGVSLPKDIIVHYMLRNLPKEYDTFKEIQTNNDKLLTYDAFKAKLLSKEIALRLVGEKCGKALAMEGHKSTFSDSRNR
jgi:hypothetical protein